MSTSETTPRSDREDGGIAGAAREPVVDTPGGGGDQPTPPWPAFVNRLGFDRFSGLYVMAIVIVFFSIVLPETFPTTTTLKGVANDQAITAILALALIIPLAAGVYDLSIAGMLGFSVMLTAYFQDKGWPVLVAILIALVAGILVGAFNGFVVVRLHVNSFIATLGMSSVLLAGAAWVSGGRAISTGFNETFLKASRSDLLGIPLPVWYLLVIAAILYFVMEYRPVGRYLYATGGNPDAARLAGVRTDRIVWGSLIAAGLLAALAGVILIAKLGIADPNVGSPYLLPAFSAAFLGATQFRNGRVNVLGTLLAVYLLAVGVKGLQLSGAALYVTDLFNGVALIVAVALAANTARKR